MTTDTEREFLATLPPDSCQCLDPDCEAGHGRVACTNLIELGIRLYRADMEDHEGLVMCEPCFDDAYGSGIYRVDLTRISRAGQRATQRNYPVSAPPARLRHASLPRMAHAGTTSAATVGHTPHVGCRLSAARARGITPNPARLVPSTHLRGLV